MRRIAPLLLALLLPVACESGRKKDESELLTPEQRDQMVEIINSKMEKLPGQVKLAKSQIEDIRPYVKEATLQLIEQAQIYHAKKTPKARGNFDEKARDIWTKMKEAIQPYMTNAQLQNFLTAYDQMIQEVRSIRLLDQ